MRRVLVIDDSVEDALLLELAFQEVAPAVEISHALDGQQALQLLQAPHAPDLVLLDLHLPGQQGLDLLNALRAQVGDEVRVVCWSSSASPRELEAIARRENVAYVEKPLRHESMLILVQGWLTSTPYPRRA
ncbi:response regulator [Deinococcus apachensis]|uniref:response regulator n=1 Tax=Deinococcus apachensis TaxID=309886 RepID=UPI00036038E6|nr:response regulator [Deinococcus apachensis]